MSCLTRRVLLPIGWDVQRPKLTLVDPTTDETDRRAPLCNEHAADSLPCCFVPVACGSDEPIGQGRAALATSFAGYKYCIHYGLLNSYFKFFTYYYGVGQCMAGRYLQDSWWILGNYSSQSSCDRIITVTRLI